MATTTTIVGSGTDTYEAHEDWAKLPDGWAMPAAGVTVDSQDRVYCFNRSPIIPSSSSIVTGTTSVRGARACSPFRTRSAPTRTTTSGSWTGMTASSSLPWNASG